MCNNLTMLKKIYLCLVFLLINQFSFINCAQANNKNYKIEFIKGKFIKNENYFLAGIKVTLRPDWKIYWKNPGDAGLPPELSWKNINNINKIEFLFPKPKAFNFFGINTFGYDNEVIFPIKIHIQDFKKMVSGKFDFNAQICNKICIPIEHEVLTNFIPNRYLNESNSNKIISYLNRVPILLVDGKNPFKKISISNNQILIKIKNQMNNFNLIIEDKNNFIFSESFIKYTKSSDQIKIKIPNGLKSDFKENSLKVTFFSNNKNFVYQFDPKTFWTHNDNIFNILMIALLGGFVLNFMPCVLPILSLKLINIISYSEENLKIIRKRIFFKISGIIFSFLFLSFLIMVLKIFGNSVIWGFQFQNEYFLLILSSVVFIFGLNLLGFFELVLPYKLNQYFINIKSQKYEDFLSGCLMTILATPCTAPFVGTAVMYALTGTTTDIFLIFIFMSLGLSIPLIFIFIKPGFIKFLPKSGKWLIYLKKFMAILFILSGLWLISIYLNFDLNNKNVQSSKNEIKWISWDLKKNPNLIRNFILENKIVFLDITADWCLTCKYNKSFILNDDKLVKIINENKVMMVQLDWSKKDKYIEKFLLSKNRYGIPFNEIYTTKYKDGFILAELLNKDQIIKLIKTQ